MTFKFYVLENADTAFKIKMIDITENSCHIASNQSKSGPSGTLNLLIIVRPRREASLTEVELVAVSSDPGMLTEIWAQEIFSTKYLCRIV